MGVWRVRDIDELEDEALRTGEHAQTADRLMQVAEREELDAVSRAEVLARAGGQWQLSGQPGEAATMYERAVDDGGHVQGDARAHLADALFELGRQDEARSLLKRIGADRPSDPVVYHCVAETLEAQRDLSGAHDWATTGVELVLGDVTSSNSLDMLLRTRFRVRRDLGLPEDDYDDMLDG